MLALGLSASSSGTRASDLDLGTFAATVAANHQDLKDQMISIQASQQMIFDSLCHVHCSLNALMMGSGKGNGGQHLGTNYDKGKGYNYDAGKSCNNNSGKGKNHDKGKGKCDDNIGTNHYNSGKGDNVDNNTKGKGKHDDTGKGKGNDTTDA